MADPKRLPEGQVNPGAKPVSAFITPASVQVARPTQFPSTPQPKGVRAVSTGGTTYVQGYNQAKQLADALVPFTKQAMATAQTVGLKYVSYKIEEGERKAWEAEAQATAALMKADEATEVAEKTAAQANRKLSKKDPQAALLANELNPYTKIGIQRGRAKIAAAEVPLGMRAFVSQSADKIDFNDGTNGLKGLQGIRAQYVNSVFQKHGLTKNGPGVDKYLMPAIEKTSEKIANDIFSRSIKFNDEVKPGLLATKIKLAIKQINGAGVFEYGENEYIKEKMDEKDYKAAARQYLASIIREDVADAMFNKGGEVRMGEAYKLLMGDTEFNTEANKNLLDSVDSSSQIEFGGKKITLKIGQRYGGSGITKADFEAKAVKNNTAAAKLAGEDFQVKLDQALNNIGEDETVEQVVNRVYAEYVESLGGEENINSFVLNKLKEVVSKSQRSTNEGGLIIQGLNPGERLDINKLINNLNGKDLLERAPEIRDRIFKIASGMSADDADKYTRSQLKLLGDKVSSAVQLSRYSDTINELIEMRTGYFLKSVYGSSRNAPLDWPTSEGRLQVRFKEIVIEAIQGEMINKGREISTVEAQKVGNEAIASYIKNNASDFSDLFPGASQEKLDTLNLGLTETASTDPTKRKEIVIPEGEKEGKKVIRLYEVDQLDSFPNRGSILRRYRDRPILPLEALREQISNIINGGEIPLSLKKARVEAQAPDLFDFLMKQVEQYPNYDLQKDFSLDDLEKLKTELVSMGSAENSLVATRLLEDTHPNLASRNEWLDPFKEVQTAGMRLSGDRFLYNYEIKMLKDSFGRDKAAGRSLDHYFKFYPELFKGVDADVLIQKELIGPGDENRRRERFLKEGEEKWKLFGEGNPYKNVG